MACSYLIDTNIFIYIRRRRRLDVLSRFDRLAEGEAAISIVSYGELYYGAVKSLNPERALRELNNLLIALPPTPMPTEAGQDYGNIRALLESRGETIGGNDLWIAAHARSAGLTLVTNNEREFRRVPGLTVENWVT